MRTSDSRRAHRPNLGLERLEDRLTPATNLQFIDVLLFGGANNQYPTGVTTDAAGNTYTVGYFEGVLDADPDANADFELQSAGNFDVYLVKLDAAGDLVYAVNFGGTDFDIGEAVAADASGNAYVTGYFSQTVDFDPNPNATFNLTSAGSLDAFVLKLNADGTFGYAAQIGGTQFDSGEDIATDASGNVYVGGKFRGTVDFDPDSGVTFNLTSAGNDDAYILKLNADGTFGYVAQIGGTQDQGVRNIVVDASSNVYATGSFTGTTDFDPNPSATFDLTSAGSDDAFVLKLDTAGALVYAVRAGNTGSDSGEGVAVDSTGAAYTVGRFSGTVDFDPDSGTAVNLNSASGNTYVWKLNADGMFGYAVQFGNGNSFTSGIALDAANNVYMSGGFNGTVDVDPDLGTAFTLLSAGSFDAYLIKLDDTGALARAIRFGGGGNDFANDVAVNADGTVYVVGSFTVTADFDPGGTAELTSAGGDDAFLAVYGDLTVSIAATDAGAAETTAPAAADTGRFTVTRSVAGQFPLSIGYTITGNATNGTDYTTLSGTVSFPTGSLTAFIDVAPTNDALTESDETVVVTLNASSAYTLGTASATVTITDNEPEVTVTAADEFATETATPAAPDAGRFRVTRTGDTTNPLTVNYQLGGSATNGTDFVALSGTVVIPAGQSSALVTVTPLNDADTEGDETVVFTLGGGSYTVATPDEATVTIFDNEAEVRLFAADADAEEGTANDGTFTVTRTGSTAAPLTVFYSVSGSATNGTDYATLGGSVTIPMGQSSATIVVDALADATSDAGETVVLTLDTNPAYTVAGPFTGQVVISEPAGTPAALPQVSLFAADGIATEGTADTGRFTVTRTGSTAADLEVFYRIVGGATNGTDYATLSGSVTIPMGQSSAEIVVSALADATGDAGETVVLALDTDPAYAVAGPSTGQVTILEPAADAPPSTPGPQLATAVGGPNGQFVAYAADGSERFRPTAYAGYMGRVNVAVG
ncbi:MAG: hypothetical protein FJ304_23395, partial [Planctomycetes bacterium]|nr:hypothetical protein [Planctomycetota bacterium]